MQAWGASLTAYVAKRLTDESFPSSSSPSFLSPEFLFIALLLLISGMVLYVRDGNEGKDYDDMNDQKVEKKRGTRQTRNRDADEEGGEEEGKEVEPVARSLSLTSLRHVFDGYFRVIRNHKAHRLCFLSSLLICLDETAKLFISYHLLHAKSFGDGGVLPSVRDVAPFEAPLIMVMVFLLGFLFEFVSSPSSVLAFALLLTVQCNNHTFRSSAIGFDNVF